MTRKFLPRFRDAIISMAPEANTIISTEGKYTLRYVPGEHVNTAARLVFVGITPGQNQITELYKELRTALLAGRSDDEALRLAKATGAFAGKVMRDRMTAMIRRFRIHEIISATEPEDIWDAGLKLLHATSVVPHAAFKDGKMFNGPFAEVLKSRLLRECFEQDFLSTLPALAADARFIAIGPTPQDALRWCVENRKLSGSQVLGAFAHPSGSAGSQVSYFIGKKALDEFHPGDPVPSVCHGSTANVINWIPP